MVNLPSHPRSVWRGFEDCLKGVLRFQDLPAVIIRQDHKRDEFPWWPSSKEAAWRFRRHRFDPWVRKIPWRRKWQPTPLFLLQNPINRGAWRATFHEVTKSQTQLSDWTPQSTSGRRGQMLSMSCSFSPNPGGSCLLVHAQQKSSLDRLEHLQ